jgi:riboflavin biosynthesis pyrimidine reductase
VTTDIGYLHLMSVAQLELPVGARVLANIMVGSNQATSALGKSSPLRTPEDGIRFHQVRARAKALIIGGNTYRNEPYQKSPLPIFVASSSLSPIQSETLTITPVSPKELISLAQERVGSPVLIEGGVNFLNSLIEEKAIDALLITHTPNSGDGDFWNDESLKSNYKLFSHEKVSKSIFEIWIPKP